MLAREEFIEGEWDEAEEGNVGSVYLCNGLITVLYQSWVVAWRQSSKDDVEEDDETNTSDNNTTKDHQHQDPPFWDVTVVVVNNSNCNSTTKNSKSDKDGEPECSWVGVVFVFSVEADLELSFDYVITFSRGRSRLDITLIVTEGNGRGLFPSVRHIVVDEDRKAKNVEWSIEWLESECAKGSVLVHIVFRLNLKPLFADLEENALPVFVAALSCNCRIFGSVLLNAVILEELLDEWLEVETRDADIIPRWVKNRVYIEILVENDLIGESLTEVVGLRVTLTEAGGPHACRPEEVIIYSDVPHFAFFRNLCFVHRTKVHPGEVIAWESQWEGIRRLQFSKWFEEALLSRTGPLIAVESELLARTSKTKETSDVLVSCARWFFFDGVEEFEIIWLKITILVQVNGSSRPWAWEFYCTVFRSRIFAIDLIIFGIPDVKGIIVSAAVTVTSDDVEISSSIDDTRTFPDTGSLHVESCLPSAVFLSFGTPFGAEAMFALSFPLV